MWLQTLGEERHTPHEIYFQPRTYVTGREAGLVTGCKAGLVSGCEAGLITGCEAGLVMLWASGERQVIFRFG